MGKIGDKVQVQAVRNCNHADFLRRIAAGEYANLLGPTWKQTGRFWYNGCRYSVLEYEYIGTGDSKKPEKPKKSNPWDNLVVKPPITGNEKPGAQVTVKLVQFGVMLTTK